MCLCIPLSKQRRHVVPCLKRPWYGTWRSCPARQNTHLEFNTRACMCAGLLRSFPQRTQRQTCVCAWIGKPHGLSNALLIALTGAVIWTGLKVTPWGFEVFSPTPGFGFEQSALLIAHKFRIGFKPLGPVLPDIPGSSLFRTVTLRPAGEWVWDPVTARAHFSLKSCL